MYQVNIENGYIVSVVSGVSEGNITEADYIDILDAIKNRPTPEEGKDFRLRADDLTWEEYDLPPVEEIPEDEREVSDEEFARMVGAIL